MRKIKNEKAHNLVGVMPFSLKLITVVPGLEKHVKYSTATYMMSYDGAIDQLKTTTGQIM